MVHNEVSNDDGNVCCDYRTKILYISSTRKDNGATNHDAAIPETEKEELSALLDEVYENLEDEEDQKDVKVEIDVKEKLGLSPYVEEVVVYISGFVSRKIIKMIRNCSKCGKLLLSGKPIIQAGTLLSLKNRGKLTIPSEDVIIICYMTEHFFRKSNQWNYVLKNTAEFVDSLVFIEGHGCKNEEHRLLLINNIIKVYYDLRLHHSLNLKNIKEKYVRRKLHKFILFSNE